MPPSHLLIDNKDDIAPVPFTAEDEVCPTVNNMAPSMVLNGIRLPVQLVNVGRYTGDLYESRHEYAVNIFEYERIFITISCSLVDIY